ncbi:MAG: hypothetical protein N2645_10635 [Clostridia bacterium]|nr:hypothetical protein [Clostridia bacterium]
MTNKKKYGCIIIILLIFAACIIISIFLRKEEFGQNTKLDSENGIKVTDRKIVKTKGWHSILSPNSHWLPGDLNGHGYHLEVHYPVVSIENNKQLEKAINNQIKQIFGVTKEDITSFYACGCDTSVYYKCELFSNILTITLETSYYLCCAAHPSLGRTTYHFDLSTGHQFDALNMFIRDDDWVINLNTVIKKNLEKKSLEIGVDDLDYTTNLVEEIGDYKLSAKGLEVCFMPYMGPAPGGGFEIVTIKYEDLDRFIEPNSLLRQALNERNCINAN